MKNSILLLSAIALLFSITSCKKETSTPTSDEPQYAAADYVPLKAGNYWVYEVVQIDSLGNETTLDGTDSTNISNQTISINGNTFFEYVNTPQEASMRRLNAFVRDSAGFIINNNGYKYLSTSKENVDLGVYYLEFALDTLTKSSYRMGNWGKEVTTSAGTFKTISSIGTHTVYPPNDSNGVNKTTYISFAPKVGIVAERYFYVNVPGYFERRLIRYSVK